MRFLRISPALRQDIDTGAHGRNPKKFQVAIISRRALPLQIVDMKKLRHGSLKSES
jgi:hypothetical protein